MQKQGRMGWGISIHQYNSRQEKYQKRFLPWDFQTEWNQTKENCIWKCVVSHNNDSTLKVLSLAVLLSCPCMAPRGSFKHHLSYLGSWNMRFLVSREAPDTPRKYSLFSWMFSILLYHFWGRFDLLVACRYRTGIYKLRQCCLLLCFPYAIFCLLFWLQLFSQGSVPSVSKKKSSWFHCAFVSGIFFPILHYFALLSITCLCSLIFQASLVKMLNILSHIHLWDLAAVQEEDSASPEGSCEAPDHTLEIICSLILKQEGYWFLVLVAHKYTALKYI